MGADRTLVAATLPHLRRRDERGLLAELGRWPRERLVEALRSDDDDTVKVAAACLGLVGRSCDCPALAQVLHHDDSVAVTMAEHALWRIWFRSGPRDASRCLCKAVCLLDHAAHDDALRLLDKVVQRAPNFAEAYNQRAIAYYLTGRYVESVADCIRTVRLNDLHFAAFAGMGHCYVQLGRHHDALGAYRTALDLHPRLEGVRQSIRQIRSRCPDGNGRVIH